MPPQNSSDQGSQNAFPTPLDSSSVPIPSAAIPAPPQSAASPPAGAPLTAPPQAPPSTISPLIQSQIAPPMGVTTVGASSSRLLPIIVVSVLAFIAIGGLGYWFLTHKTATNSPQAQVASGDSLLVIPGIKLNSNGYLDESVYAGGLRAHNTGGNDSLVEYKEIKDLQTTADTFITALGAHDWTKAYSMLATSEKNKIAQATITHDWTTEYPENFTLTSIKQNSIFDTDTSEYADDTCRKDFHKGWSKTISSGAYKSPFFAPRGLQDQSISAGIDLALIKESGVWKISGDNNDRHDASGVVSGDAYATAQASRPFINPWTC